MSNRVRGDVLVFVVIWFIMKKVRFGTRVVISRLGLTLHDGVVGIMLFCEDLIIMRKVRDCCGHIKAVGVVASQLEANLFDANIFSAFCLASEWNNGSQVCLLIII